MTGQEFRQHRKALGLSQKAIAELFQVTDRTIINQEQADEVYPMYAYSISFLVMREKQQAFRAITEEMNSLCK